MALRELDRLNVDIAFLTEAKLTGIHTAFSHGYHVCASVASSPHKGGVALVWRDRPNWSLESEKQVGPDVVSMELVTGGRRFLVIGAYISPNETDGRTIAQILDAKAKRPGLRTIILGDFNVDFHEGGDNSRDTDIVAAMASIGVDCIVDNFRLARNHRDGFTWKQMRGSELITSRCDSILADCPRDFTNYQIRSPPGNLSDHDAVVGWLRAGPSRTMRGYAKARKTIPWSPPATLTECDILVNQLTGLLDPKHPTARKKSPWISEDTWKLVDQRAELKRQQAAPEELRAMKDRIRRSLRQDRKERVKKAGEAIENALEGDDLREAWNLAKGWYRQASKKSPRPSHQDFDELHAERSELYRAEPSPGQPIPVRLSAPFSIADEPPDHDEVAEACRDLRRGRAAGVTGIRAEDLQGWLKEYEREDGDPAPWEMVLQLVDRAFRHGELPSALPVSILVIIPKPNGGVRGIGLLETIWKLMERIIDRRLARGIEFHDALHGFRKRRGCGTAVLECRLEQERALYNGETLFQVFLDLTKAYDTLDRERTLLILKEYGVGDNTLRLLDTFWQRLKLCPRQAGYYARQLVDSQRGVTQGGIASPTIFNVVIDAIVRELLHRFPTEITAAFYADDGRLAGTNAERLQSCLVYATELFARVGLKMNAPKTKAMVGHNGSLRLQLSTPAYKRRLDDSGDTYTARKRRKVSCPTCHAEVQERYLARHILSRHNDLNRPSKRRKLLEESERLPVRYNAFSPSYRWPLSCPVPDCPGRAGTRDALRKHFCHRHPQDEIDIFPEGYLPKCPQCGMQVNATNSHLNSKRCQNGRARKRKRELEIDHLRALEAATFTVDGIRLENVETFVYLGRVIAATTTDWPAVHRNIRAARKRWARFSTLLRREGANPRISGLFYKAVVLSTLLYACETWVISAPILRSLEGFHHRAARGIARLTIRYIPDEDRWEYPPTSVALDRAGLHPIQTYLDRRRRYLLQYAKDRPLVQECLEMSNTTSRDGPRRKYWWSQLDGPDEEAPQNGGPAGQVPATPR